MAATPDDVSATEQQRQLHHNLHQSFNFIAWSILHGAIDAREVHNWSHNVMQHQHMRRAAAAAVHDPSAAAAAADERKKRIEELREKDENCHTSFSRECRLCLTPNPRSRVCLSRCGHIICLACAEQLAQGHRCVTCPYCQQRSYIVKLFEDEEQNQKEKEENDISVEKNPNPLHVEDARNEADFDHFEDRSEGPFDDQEADYDDDEEFHEDNEEESDGPRSIDDLVLFLNEGVKKEEKIDRSVEKNLEDGFWELCFDGNVSIDDPTDSIADDSGSISTPKPLSEEEIGYFNE